MSTPPHTLRAHGASATWPNYCLARLLILAVSSVTWV
jgi:hypothetical protein